MLPKQALVDKLNEIRAAYGHPMVVNSAARCQVYNRKISKARKSAHIEGLAADISDEDGKLYAWLTDEKAGRLDKFNIWIEDKANTSGWVHIQIRPTINGRIFKPY